MSTITVGIGTSHSPLLTIEPALWMARGKDDMERKAVPLADGRVVSYDELAAETGDRYLALATLECFEAQALQAQDALNRLSSALADARLDVLIIVGDDQEELFTGSYMPALAVYSGDELVTYPKSELAPDLPEWHHQANRAYEMDTPHRHPAAPGVAEVLINGLIDAGVDVAVVTNVLDPYEAAFGHAYGFVLARLCQDQDIPVIPILLNTYYPPNVLRPSRCYDVGHALRGVLESDGNDARVGIVASGGLSHFAVDEELDRTVLQALQDDDAEALRRLPSHALRSGSSEILNWIMAAGALRGLKVTYVEYVPVRRTSAGTGIGLGFTIWQP